MGTPDNKGTDRTEPGAQAPGMPQEADIGSGEKTPGEQETDAMIKDIPAAPKDQAPDAGGNK